ncbi:MAG: CRISPR-associated endoribonuclease Cas6 [Bacteroidota bacterium]
MRVHLKTQPCHQIIPFNHQHLLVGTIHKWLGWNEEHGRISLYSFSRLTGGKSKPEGLTFETGSSFFFSSHDVTIIKRLIEGVTADSAMFHGLRIQEIMMQEDPDLINREIFQVGSPIFIKRREGENIAHILYKDPRASACLVESLKSKMEVAGMEDDSLEINFVSDYQKASTKKINYNGIENRASWCPVVIKGKPETKLFAWNVGLGNSTGIGFGAII